MRPDDSAPLRAWLGVFAAPYRAPLGWLLGLNLLSAVAVFVELQLLRALTVVLSRAPAPVEGSCGLGTWIADGFPLAPEACGARLPLFLLGAYTVSVLAQSAVDLAALAKNSRLTTAARRDVERELLRNLLQQDDAFYLRRAPSEIISRLGADLQRVGGRRQIVISGIATGLSVVAVAFVLVMQSWLAAGIGLSISLLGVVAAKPVLRRLQDLDRRLIASDEQVKAAFEDILQGVAEIQVSGLLGRVLRSFGQRQGVRDAVALENADLNNLNTVSQKLTFTVGFIAVLALVVFTDLFHEAAVPGQAPSGEGDATAGLIVVLIATLPQLYFKVGDLVNLFTQFRIADVSASRLLQYAAPAPRPAGTDAAQEDGAVVLRGVRYQFSGSQAVQGGPAGISLAIPPRGLTGVVGPAGAGKSTLIRLMLGRQRPVEGAIHLPGSGEPGATFVYLPQRPVLFDATLRDNLSAGELDAAGLAAVGARLASLGLLDLIRQKGLDASPGQAAAQGCDLPAIRAGFRAAAEQALGAALQPYGPGRAAPRQMVVEGLLGCAVDGAAFAQRLTAPSSREPVRGLAARPIARPLAALGAALIRRTAPLLTQFANPDDYNRVAAVAIETGVWQLRAGALDRADAPADPPQPVLVAVALSARMEELEGAALPVPDDAERALLDALVAGIALPVRADALNTLLSWRENLLFAVPDPANTRRIEQVDRTVLDHLRGGPLDPAVIEAGLAFAVGRGGGRLSGGQQQLVALGRALMNPAPFLVLDEPSSAFHPRMRADLVGVLQAEARTRSVIVVTHDTELARGCDRLLFVRDGAVAADGPWDRLAEGDADFRAWIDDGKGTAR